MLACFRGGCLDNVAGEGRRLLDLLTGDFGCLCLGGLTDTQAPAPPAPSMPSIARIAEYGRAMPDPGAVFDTARDSLTELFRARPLALGALGLAIGAGIAAALPKTDIEDAYLGELFFRT